MISLKLEITSTEITLLLYNYFLYSIRAWNHKRDNLPIKDRREERKMREFFGKIIDQKKKKKKNMRDRQFNNRALLSI